MLRIAAENLGTHSMRKGSATYCSSGSTCCPPAAAIQMRAGVDTWWCTRYIHKVFLNGFFRELFTNFLPRYEAASDMFVGRTAAGLPLMLAEFAITPPHFDEISILATESAKMVFPTLPESFTPISFRLLASLVFHSQWLRDNLSSSHRLFHTVLFAQEHHII
jgi:hypothetical protein